MSKTLVTITLWADEVRELERLLMAEGGRNIIAERKYHIQGRHELADMYQRQAQECVVLIAKLKAEA